MINQDDKMAAHEMAEIREARIWKDTQDGITREHEVRLKQMDIDKAIEIKKLELEMSKNSTVKRDRYDLARRTVAGIVRLPVIPLAIIAAMILELCHRDIPEGIDNILDI